MITKWILGMLGLFMPTYHQPDLAAAKRRVRVTARWHDRIASRAQCVALDAIEQQQSDTRPAELASATETNRETMAALLERLK